MSSNKSQSNRFLTTFAIHNTSPSLRRCEAKDFMRSLVGIPHLENLYLQQFLPSNAYELVRGRHINLSSLRKVQLEDAVTPIANFFSWCEIYAAPQVEVVLTGLTPTSVVPIAHCLRTLSKAWKDPTTPQHRRQREGAHLRELGREYCKPTVPLLLSYV
jgi:hypothetical protein